MGVLDGDLISPVCKQAADRLRFLVGRVMTFSSELSSPNSYVTCVLLDVAPVGGLSNRKDQVKLTLLTQTGDTAPAYLPTQSALNLVDMGFTNARGDFIRFVDQEDD